MELSFTDGFNQSVSLTAMNRQCTNFYPKYIEDGDIIIKRLFGTPGQSQLVTTGTAATEANRGREKMADIVYFVNGTTLYRLNADFTTTSLGTVMGSGKVSMANNGIQLMILSPGGNGYIFNKDTDTFAQITDADFTANGLPQLVMFIDGYFMVITNTKKFTVSNLNDGLSWDALDFGTAESDPDVIVSQINLNTEAYIIGSQTTDVFENIGGTDFPFIANGLVLDKGCFARFSTIKTPGGFMFIGGGKDEDPSIWSLEGNGYVRKSNTGVALLLNALTTVELDQVSSYAYEQDNSSFVAWELPKETIVYGIDTGKWHLRRSQVDDVAGNTQTVGWRSTGLLSAYSKLLCFDTQDGRVGDVSLSFTDEYGTEIQREFDVNTIRAEKHTFTVPRIEVTIEAGLGDSSTPDPKIRMKLARDNKVFGGERVRSMGATGKTNKRVVWRQNGMAKHSLLPRFLTSAKVRPIITGVDAEIRVGRV